MPKSCLFENTTFQSILNDVLSSVTPLTVSDILGGSDDWARGVANIK